MLGPVVNATAIIVGSLAGCFLIRGIPARFEELIKKAIGLFVIYAGIKGALENQRVLLMLMSLVSGAALGELINIDALMNRLGVWAEKRLNMGGSGGKHSFAKGFTNASILFCTGSLIIVGSLQSGLLGNHEVLFMKAVLDGVTSLIFAASMGIGVAFSAIPLFLYESGVVVAANAVKDYLSADIVREMSAVGSLLVAGIGFNFMGIIEIKVANIIPAIFVPLVYMTLETLIRF